MNSPRGLVGLATSLLMACGGSPPSLVSPAPRESARPRSSDAQDLRRALDALCDLANSAMADRSVPLSRRFRAFTEGAEAMEDSAVLDAFGRRVTERPASHHSHYERLVAQARSDGIPDFRCPSLERLLALHAAGEEDIDPAREASFADDLAFACQVVTELEGTIAEEFVLTVASQKISEH